ncbi:hypothetical protein DID78_03885 [Candidatus Marinamargulisbacteria bacterium SCGC AG-343-D04]|nr:hypothetical protein DID78_03885 [Candidatus Marinamargulisbacteria bacterium SCGC AG-343-D04]
MKSIQVKNTYDLQLSGLPDTACDTVDETDFYGVSPSRIKELKAKLLVKEGQAVKVGSCLFFDKKNEKNVFLSPVSGTVEKIEYGDRRALQNIVIKSDKQFQKETLFDKQTLASIDKLEDKDVADLIQKGGLWSVFTAYPFQMTPNSDLLPPAIYVSIDSDEPHLPQSQIFCEGEKDNFLAGLKALKKMTSTVHVGVADKTKLKETKILEHVTHRLKGHYPANNHGVFLYYNKKDASENSSWGVSAQDVIRIGKLLTEGTYPNEKVIVVAGALVKKPRHLKVVEGYPVKALEKELTKKAGLRVVAGGVLTGQRSSIDSFISYNEYAVHFLQEGKEQEMFTFFRPGFDKPTFGRTYLSALVKKEEWEMNTCLNGGHRACIACGECPKVCPVESHPQFFMKDLEAGDIEKPIEQGFLDCVSCGICTYVCPSKIELDSIFYDARQKIAKEAGV